MIHAIDPADWPVWQHVMLPFVAALTIGATGWQSGAVQLERALDRFVVEEQQLIGELAIQAQRVAAKAALLRETAAFEAAIDDRLTALPDAERLTGLLASISSTARAAGLSVVLFQPEEHRIGNLYHAREVLLRVRGTYPDLLRFTAAIAAAREPMALDIADLRTDNADIVLTMDARIEIRWQSDSRPLTDPDDSSPQTPDVRNTSIAPIVDLMNLPPGLRDPFQPPYAEARPPGPRPDPSRQPDPLEAWPLDALKLVGTVTMTDQRTALVQTPRGSVLTVQVGEHLGQHHGRVKRIDTKKVEIVELLLIDNDRWVEHPATLQAVSEP